MLKRFMIALTGLLMVAAPISLVGSPAADATTACSSVVISGHRAHVYTATSTAEETLHAANYAKAHNAAILEQDIWRLGNGRWVVNHDSTWSRTIDGSKSGDGTGPALSWPTSQTVESTTNAEFNEGPVTKGLLKPAIDLTALMTYAAANPQLQWWIEVKSISGIPGNTALNDLITQEDNNPAGNVGYYGTKSIVEALQARDVALHPSKGQTGHYGVNFSPGEANDGTAYHTVNDYPTWIEYVFGPLTQAVGSDFEAPTGTFNSNALNRSSADGGPMIPFSRGLNSGQDYSDALAKNFVVFDADDTGDLYAWLNHTTPYTSTTGC